MTKRRQGSCTTFLAGKKATLDGSVMIARNEDGGDQPNPQRFVVVTPAEQPRQFHLAGSGGELLLPDQPLGYTSTPDVNQTAGVWAGGGINQLNVAMTATETITTNPRILGIDPFVETGIGEADIVTIVLPYITSAKEGVLRLGALLEQYGTYEANGIAFADQEEIWYLETIGGHHWVAIRIPDEAYVIAPNRLNIDFFDFDGPDTLYASDLPTLIEHYHLNPDFEGVNLRHIFGSATLADSRYNNPRAWYVQQYFNPEIKQQPTDHDLPFLCYSQRKISIEDVKWVLSSHYQNTAFDPYGEGSITDRKRYRPIGINRNLETHILQIRSSVPQEIAGIHWLAFGPNTFNSLVPFYGNVVDTPACYRDTTLEFDPTNMYWLTQLLAVLGDSNYSLYEELQKEYEETLLADCRGIQLQVDQGVREVADIQTYLDTVNERLAQKSLQASTELLGEMVKCASPLMNLRFSLKD